MPPQQQTAIAMTTMLVEVSADGASFCNDDPLSGEFGLDFDRDAETTTTTSPQGGEGANDSSVHEVMMNYVALFDVFREDSSSAEGGCDDFDPDGFRVMIANVYDEDNVAVVVPAGPDREEGTSTRGFVEVYEAFLEFRDLGFRVVSVDCQVESATAFRFAIMGTNGTLRGTMQGRAFVDTPKGKIIRTERMGTQILQDRLHDKLSTFFDSFSGDGNIPINFRHLVTEVFSTSLIVSCEEGGIHFDDFYDMLLDLHESGCHGELVKTKRHDVGIEVSFRMYGASFDYVVSMLGECQGGKIRRIQPKDNCSSFAKLFGQVAAANSSKVISGQVLARFLPDYFGEDFASNVQPLPEQAEGFLLGDGTDLQPTRRAQHVLRISMEKRFRHPGLGYQLRTNERDRYAGGAYIAKKGCSGILGGRRTANRFVLVDADNEPIACCDRSDESIYLICGAEPMLEGDLPVSTNCGKEDADFYPWYRVQNKVCSSADTDQRDGDKLHVQIWNGETYDPLWEVVRNSGCQSPGQRRLTLARADFVIQTLDGASFLAILQDRRSRGIAGEGWNLVVAPGVDPAAILCVAATVESLNNEKK